MSGPHVLRGSFLALALAAAALQRRQEVPEAPAAPSAPAEPPGSPYKPSKADWGETWQMLCGHCRPAVGCAVVEGMILHSAGDGPWPEGGWVTDAGAGVSCLSYEPAPMKRLPRQQLRALARRKEADLPPVCSGCAARKGSEASVSLHTRRDYAAAVQQGALFFCHERLPADRQDWRLENLCGGWCRAVRRRGKR